MFLCACVFTSLGCVPRSGIARSCRASLVAQWSRIRPLMQETQVQSLGREDPLEKEVQPTPVFLPGKSMDREDSGSFQSMGSHKSQTQLSIKKIKMYVQG